MNFKAIIRGSRLGVVLGVILGLLLAASITYAAVNLRTIPSTITITSSTPGVEVYSDSQCTQLLSTLDYGSLARPSSSSGIVKPKTFYVKNTGNTTLNLQAMPSGLPFMTDVTSSQTYGVLSLSPQQTGSFTLSLHIDSSISPGTYPFSVYITQQ